MNADEGLETDTKDQSLCFYKVSVCPRGPNVHEFGALLCTLMLLREGVHHTQERASRFSLNESSFFHRINPTDHGSDDL